MKIVPYLYIAAIFLLFIWISYIIFQQRKRNNEAYEYFKRQNQVNDSLINNLLISDSQRLTSENQKKCPDGYIWSKNHCVRIGNDSPVVQFTA